MDEYKRRVGEESSRTYVYNLERGFFDRYMSGFGLDIGFAGYREDILPILPGAIGVDTNYPDYDGKTLPFNDETQDYIYSSHCLEHIQDWVTAIQEWYRVTKLGGHIVTVVPHMYLYEKKGSLPSNWNQDHKRFYTPSSLLNEFEKALKPNSYRVRLLEDGDRGFNYSIPPENHSNGQYEITLVIQRIKEPTWQIK